MERDLRQSVALAAERFFRGYREQAAFGGESLESESALWDYFSNHSEGNGIWKWEHYFEVYERHFSKFIGARLNLLEIGIYSGGSLAMWRDYFGEGCKICGVDIEDACKAYESEGIDVVIGDQGDREFWRSFRAQSSGVDILIDDGGHTMQQQQVTLEEMLPQLRAGGVYLCEDIHGLNNRFAEYAAGLVRALNQFKHVPGEELHSEVSPFQRSIHSIHFYPYALVIEKTDHPRSRFSAPRRGDKWQPHLAPPKRSGESRR